MSQELDHIVAHGSPGIESQSSLPRNISSFADEASTAKYLQAPRANMGAGAY